MAVERVSIRLSVLQSIEVHISTSTFSCWILTVLYWNQLVFRIAAASAVQTICSPYKYSQEVQVFISLVLVVPSKETMCFLHQSVIPWNQGTALIFRLLLRLQQRHTVFSWTASQKRSKIRPIPPILFYYLASTISLMREFHQLYITHRSSKTLIAIWLWLRQAVTVFLNHGRAPK